MISSEILIYTKNMTRNTVKQANGFQYPTAIAYGGKLENYLTTPI